MKERPGVANSQRNHPLSQIYAMPQVIGVTKAITNLNQAHQTFQLQPTTNPTFFPEWLEPLPELSLGEIETCDRRI